MDYSSDKLDYVLMLAEEGNLTRAAARLYISQPTLTQYINRLERELGIKLFDRTIHPITVTPAGVIYIDEMKKIRNETLALQARLTEMQQKRRTFSIGIPAVRSEHLAPDLLAEFLRAFPDVSINVDTRLEETLEKDLAAGTLDFAIGVLSTAYPGIYYECIEELSVNLLVPRSSSIVAGLSPKEGTPEHPYLINPRKLDGERILLPRVGGGQYGSAMRMIRKFNIVSGPVINCNNLNTLYQTVARGVGILFTTPKPFLNTFPQLTDRLAFCVLQREPEFQKSYAGCRESEQDDPLISWTFNWLRRKKKEGPL